MYFIEGGIKITLLTTNSHYTLERKAIKNIVFKFLYTMELVIYINANSLH